MTRVLVLSHTTGYQLRAFNDAAESLGIELTFATDRCHKLDDPWQDRAVPVRFYDLDTSVDLIVRRAREFPVQGVIAVGDRPVLLAARAAEALGIRWHSVAGALASTDKRRSRAAIAAAGLPSPRFGILDARFELGDSGSGIKDSGSGIGDSGSAIRDERFPGFPCVLKPVGLSGSRGVIRANDESEFTAAFERIRALLARPQIRAARTGLEDEILVEQYIEGSEYAVEGVLTDGMLQVFAIFDKPDPLVGPFFEETIYVTPSRAPADRQRHITEAVAGAARALGLSHGPIHAECRVTAARDVYVLEAAARPIGGLCSRVLTFESGRSLEAVLLEHALDRPVDHVSREPQAAAVMMIPIPHRGLLKGILGEEAARDVRGVTDVRITAKQGQLLEPLPEAGSYLGFIFAKASLAAEAEMAVRSAFGHLRFDIARELPIT